jgi:hypothetical protein
MPDEMDLRPISDDEQLARFVVYSKWVRADQTVRPDAFIPHPYPDLSVTRHAGISEIELWQLGQAVAEARPATLYGRADVGSGIVTGLSLRIIPSEPPRNHANIRGWPLEKARQKSIAQEIVASARYVAKPIG